MMYEKGFEDRWWEVRHKSKPLLRVGKLEEALDLYRPLLKEEPEDDYVPKLIFRVLSGASSLRKKEAIPFEEEKKLIADVELGLVEDDFIPADLPYVKEVLIHYYPEDAESRYEDLLYGVERV